MKTKITQNLLLPETSSQNSEISLDPWFITGFADAESTFTVLIAKGANYKSG